MLRGRYPSTLLALSALVALGASAVPHDGTIAPPPRRRKPVDDGPSYNPPVAKQPRVTRTTDESADRMSAAEAKRARKMAKRAAEASK